MLVNFRFLSCKFRVVKWLICFCFDWWINFFRVFGERFLLLLLLFFVLFFFWLVGGGEILFDLGFWVFLINKLIMWGIFFWLGVSWLFFDCRVIFRIWRGRLGGIILLVVSKWLMFIDRVIILWCRIFFICKCYFCKFLGVLIMVGILVFVDFIFWGNSIFRDRFFFCRVWLRKFLIFCKFGILLFLGFFFFGIFLLFFNRINFFVFFGVFFGFFIICFWWEEFRKIFFFFKFVSSCL